MASLAALLAGAASVLGFAPFELPLLQFFSLLVLFGLWQKTMRPRLAAWLGWLWGLAYFLCGVSWVYISLHDMGGLPALPALMATIFLCAALALYPALAGAVYLRYRSQNTLHAMANAWLLASLWLFTEWLRGWLFSGFPWLASGYAHTHPSPLAGYAAVLGVYGMGWLAAFCAALLVCHVRSGIRRNQQWVALILVLCIPATGWLLGRMDWTQATGQVLRVSLLQGNIPQESKWDQDRVAVSLMTYAQLIRQYPADLLVLPETALPMYLDDVPPDYMRFLARHAPLITGVAAWSRGQVASTAAEFNTPLQSVNVALGVDREGRLQSYAKNHLVPFGEYTPPGFAWFMALLHMPMSDFSPGPKIQPPLQLAGQQIASNICYEDLFGEDLIKALPAATLLVNLSNTAWFGDSLAQPQHLQIARVRAMETGRPMLRATNTGMTAAIAPDGRILASLPPFTTQGLTLEIRGYQGLTPYARWGNQLVLLLGLCGLIPAWRNRHQPGEPAAAA